MNPVTENIYKNHHISTEIPQSFLYKISQYQLKPITVHFVAKTFFLKISDPRGQQYTDREYLQEAKTQVIFNMG